MERIWFGFRWVGHSADIKNYNSSLNRVKFPSLLVHWLNVWRMIKLLNLSEVQWPAWKWGVATVTGGVTWGLLLTWSPSWSLGRLVADPASGTIGTYVGNECRKIRTFSFTIGKDLDKKITPTHKPQFLSLKKVQKHLFILRAVLAKAIMHLKCLGCSRNLINIHFFSLSFSFRMPSWISSQGVWAGKEGHPGVMGSVQPHSSKAFRKWWKLTLGLESGDVWVRDRVKLRFNLSPSMC